MHCCEKFKWNWECGRWISTNMEISFLTKLKMLRIWQNMYFIGKCGADFLLFYKGTVIYDSLCPKKGIKVDGRRPSSEPFLWPNQCSWPLSVLDLCEELHQEAGLKCLIASLPPWTYLDIFTLSTTRRATLQPTVYSLQHAKSFLYPRKSFHIKFLHKKSLCSLKMRAFEPLGAFEDQN